MKKYSIALIAIIISLITCRGNELESIKNTTPGLYSFSYKVEIPVVKGKKLALWVPYPAENRHQRVLKTDIVSPLKWKITQGRRYGNKMVYLEGRPSQNKIQIQFNYEIMRKPTQGFTKLETAQDERLNPALYLGPNKLLPNAPLFKDMANKQIGSQTETKQIIKTLYDYVVATLQYDKSGEGWGKGDPIWACTNKRGNCTDFHSLFIALTRSRKIPARFHIGFSIPPKMKGKIGGYHCWAEVYNEGWLPLDATEGKKSGRPDDYFGQLPDNRIQFSTGRDIELTPRQKQAALNYFIYPYMEVDGVKSETVRTKFSFERISRQVAVSQER